MAVLIRPKLWGGQKPPLGAQLDRGHPLGAALAARWLLNEAGGGRLTDLVGFGPNPPVDVTGLSGWQSSVAGPALTVSATGTANLGAGTSRIGLSEGFSWYVQLAFTNVGILSAPLIWDSAGYFVSCNAGPVTLGRVGVAHDVSGGSVTVNRMYNFLVTVGLGANPAVTLYLNGVAVASGTTTRTTPSSNLTLGSAAFGCSAVVADVAVFSRCLQPSEAAWLQAEPYAGILPQAPVQRWFVPPPVAPSGPFPPWPQPVRVLY